ncbi:MAG: glycosyltransferase, partial [bacterium]|nr:glycosyltransferase [bacterium]
MIYQQNCSHLTQSLRAQLKGINTNRLALLDCLKTADKTVKVTLSDGGSYLLHSKYAPVKEAEKFAAGLDISNCRHIVLAGFGLGYHVRALLERMETTGQLYIIAVNIDIFKLALQTRDLSDILTDDRVHIITAAGKTAFQKQIHDLEKSLRSATHTVLLHPPSMQVMGVNDEEIKKTVGDREFLSHRQKELRARVKELETGNLEGRVSGKPAATVLVPDYHLFIPSLKQHLKEQGYIVQGIAPSQLTVQRFNRLCDMTAPAFVLAVNFSAELAFLCSKKGVPYVSWTIDPLSKQRLTLLEGTDPALCLAYAHRQKLVERLRRQGIEDAEFLPLAAPGDLRKPIRDEHKLAPYCCPVSFVGNALVDEQEMLKERLDQLGLHETLRLSIDEWLQEFAAGKADQWNFYGFMETGADIPSWLKQSLKKNIPLPKLSELFNGALSSLLRIRRTRELQPSGIRVYGRKKWAQFIDNYHGVADHGEELTLIYNASTINLDIPRVYQRDIVTMRVFDILASGGLLLTEPAADLLDLFSDGVHLLTYKNTGEAVKLLRYYREHPKKKK